MTIPIINQDYLINTLSSLVRINSINPVLSNEAIGEEEIAKFIADTMQAMRLEVHLHEIAPKRYNVVGIKRGKGSGKCLMLNAHMDTVGIEGMDSPLTPLIKDGRLYGRGSQDMKGGLAVILATVKSLQDSKIDLDGDIVLTFVCDEEHASLGTKDLVKHYHADAAVITEPTDLCLTIAHRGFVWLEIETFGRAAHGSRYQEGIDAIMHMGRFLSRIEKLGNDLITSPPHPIVGPANLHASRILGGTEVLTYPAHCFLEMEWRTTPDQNSGMVESILSKLLEELAAEDPQFHSQLRVTVSQPPFAIDPKTEIAHLVQSTLEKHLKNVEKPGGASYWTDAALLMQANIPTVVVGPKGSGLHTNVEWVDLQSCFEMGEVLIDVVTDYCSRIKE